MVPWLVHTKACEETLGANVRYSCEDGWCSSCWHAEVAWHPVGDQDGVSWDGFGQGKLMEADGNWLLIECFFSCPSIKVCDAAKLVKAWPPRIIT